MLHVEVQLSVTAQTRAKMLLLAWPTVPVLVSHKKAQLLQTMRKSTLFQFLCLGQLALTVARPVVRNIQSTQGTFAAKK